MLEMVSNKYMILFIVVVMGIIVLNSKGIEKLNNNQYTNTNVVYSK